MIEEKMAGVNAVTGVSRETDPLGEPAPPVEPTLPGGSTEPEEALDVIERQSAVLVRHFELLRRRGKVYIDLDGAEYLLLRTLDDLGPVDIGTLASALGLDPSTAGRQVSAMHAAQLVLREQAPDDRRRTIITATPEGRRRMEAVRQRRRQRTAELLESWDAPDLQTLGVMFTRYNAAVWSRYIAVEQD